MIETAIIWITIDGRALDALQEQAPTGTARQVGPNAYKIALEPVVFECLNEFASERGLTFSDAILQLFKRPQ